MTSIEGFENYLIFEDGVIINIKTGREMKLKIDNGYYRVGLYKNGKQQNFLVHRLIALAYIPNPDNKPCIDHINRITTDNRIENLRWATHQENMRNLSCYRTNNLGYQFIYKNMDKNMKQGFSYRFEIQRPELKHKISNKDLQTVIEYRNKFCNDNHIEINDA